MPTVIFERKNVHVPKEAVKFCDKTLCVAINFTVKGTVFPFINFLEWHWVLSVCLPNVLTKRIFFVSSILLTVPWPVSHRGVGVVFHSHSRAKRQNGVEPVK